MYDMVKWIRSPNERNIMKVFRMSDQALFGGPYIHYLRNRYDPFFVECILTLFKSNFFCQSVETLIATGRGATSYHEVWTLLYKI